MVNRTHLPCPVVYSGSFDPASGCEAITTVEIMNTSIHPQGAPRSLRPWQFLRNLAPPSPATSDLFFVTVYSLHALGFYVQNVFFCIIILRFVRATACINGALRFPAE